MAEPVTRISILHGTIYGKYFSNIEYICFFSFFFFLINKDQLMAHGCRINIDDEISNDELREGHVL